MSLLIRTLDLRKATKNRRTTKQLLDLVPQMDFGESLTKQSFKDETDINKIMARFDVTGTISHLAKYEAVYRDFSDFDFHGQMNQLTRGREIFDALPAELRQEFGQSPQKFFDYVNDPKNHDDLRSKLPGLAAPGKQLQRTTKPDADLQTADDAADVVAEPKKEKSKPTAETSSDAA